MSQEKLESVRTFLLLSSKILNKRAHPTQWHLAEGGVSDLLQKNFSTISEPFMALRFALRNAIPILANRMLEDDERRIYLFFLAFEESNACDLIDMVVRELSGVDSFVKGTKQILPGQKHADYEKVRGAFFVLLSSSLNACFL